MCNSTLIFIYQKWFQGFGKSILIMISYVVIPSHSHVHMPDPFLQSGVQMCLCNREQQWLARPICHLPDPGHLFLKGAKSEDYIDLHRLDMHL